MKLKDPLIVAPKKGRTNTLTKFFFIDGYWKDNKEIFSGYIITEAKIFLKKFPISENEIFFYGLNEIQLKHLVNIRELTPHDFVIKNYTPFFI